MTYLKKTKGWTERYLTDTLKRGGRVDRYTNIRVEFKVRSVTWNYEGHNSMVNDTV